MKITILSEDLVLLPELIGSVCVYVVSDQGIIRYGEDVFWGYAFGVDLS